MKDWLIKLLGGYTQKDLDKKYDEGAMAISKFYLAKAQSLNGVSADNWCNTMYTVINNYCTGAKNGFKS